MSRPATLFNKLRGFRRAPPGLEWWLLKRLPAIALIGTALPVIGALVALGLAGAAADARFITGVEIALIGFLSLHWTVVLTVAIACVIVVVAKGPAYVADGYPLPDSER